MKPLPPSDPVAAGIRNAMDAAKDQHEYARLGGLLTRHHAGEAVKWPEDATPGASPAGV